MLDYVKMGIRIALFELKQQLSYKLWIYLSKVHWYNFHYVVIQDISTVKIQRLF